MSLSNNVKQATALKYQMDKENSAPVVVASGMGVVAQKIVDVAIENNVPIFEDDSLAALLSQLSVGREIPAELFQTIVDIYVYFLNFTVDSTNQTSIPKQETQQSIQHSQEHAEISQNDFFPAQPLAESFQPLDGFAQPSQINTNTGDDDDFVPF